jgi:hypothetical protein
VVTNVPPSYMSPVLKSGNLNLLEPYGPLHACKGKGKAIALPLPLPPRIYVFHIIVTRDVVLFPKHH